MENLPKLLKILEDLITELASPDDLETQYSQLRSNLLKSVEFDDFLSEASKASLRSILQGPYRDISHRIAPIRLLESIQANLHHIPLLASSSPEKSALSTCDNKIRVAFMPWDTHLSEFAIIMSKKFLNEDENTSITITELNVTTTNTDSIPQEIRRDVPGVGEDALKNVESNGIIRIGTKVKPGDILVCKVSQKEEFLLTPEESQIRKAFGDCAAGWKDSSQRVPNSVNGIVEELYFSLSNSCQDRLKTFESKGLEKIANLFVEQKRMIDKQMDDLTEVLSDTFLGENFPDDIVNSQDGSVIITANRKVTKTLLRKVALSHKHIKITHSPSSDKLLEVITSFIVANQSSQEDREKELKVLRSELYEPNCKNIENVELFISTKCLIQRLASEKIHVYHGNKVVKITETLVVSEEEMPTLNDGTPIDIVLNPLGVNPELNVSEILEKHLQVAVKLLGFEVSIPIFDYSKKELITAVMSKIKCNGDVGNAINLRFIGPKSPPREGCLGSSEDNYEEGSGTTQLFNRKSQEPFQNKAVVGFVEFRKMQTSDSHYKW